MSFQTTISHTVTTLVECLLPPHSGDKGLVISLDLRIMAPNPEPDHDRPRVFREVQFIFQRRMAYTTVFMATRPKRSSPLVFQYQSHHDSCWRTDGVETPLGTLYFELCKEVAPSARPIDCGQFCRVDKVKLFDSVPIKKGPDQYGSRRFVMDESFQGI